MEQSSELQRWKQKALNLELQLAEKRRGEIQATEERDFEMLKNVLSPHKNRSPSTSTHDLEDVQTRRVSVLPTFFIVWYMIYMIVHVHVYTYSNHSSSFNHCLIFVISLLHLLVLLKYMYWVKFDFLVALTHGTCTVHCNTLLGMWKLYPQIYHSQL